ncbi:YheT family hydrolase [Spongiimicrobium salis]|uniref:YheT family hydrolase n=1 Tax=Spongiimicrobium salis TaxID=1667022 RepID=UPI00374D24EA
MPLIPSPYNPPFLFKNGHFSTIYAGVFRKVEGIDQQRERIDLPDGDFLDLDWSYAQTKTDKVVLLIHGLEGNAQRPYITGSAKAFNLNGYDVCAINLRSCSGSTNLLFRSYHSGATEDLIAVLHHILEKYAYTSLYLKGFSLGGNLVLKYLGEGNAVPAMIKGAVAVSVPCDLHSSLIQLLMPKNLIYARRFKKHLLQKLRAKQILFPDQISDKDILKVKTLKDFDDIYTSKAHGFKDGLDYYTQCSSLQFLEHITVPTLILNAKNDSFLGPSCYPIEKAEKNPNLHLEIPLYGGHVGFHVKNNASYTEKRAINFFEDYL